MSPQESTPSPIENQEAVLQQAETPVESIGGTALEGQVETTARPAQLDITVDDIEAAAFRPQRNNLPPAQTSAREGYWKPATQSQIEDAAKHGFDLKAANDKYYPTN